MNKPYAVATLLSLLVLAGCASALTPTTPSAASIVGGPMHRPESQPLQGPIQNRSTLYVMNRDGTEAVVSVYANGGASFLRSIDIAKTYYALGFAVDSFGKLYASAFYEKPAILNVFSNRGAKLVRTIKQQSPFVGLALDPSGNLFTACAHTVCEYAAGKHQIIRRLSDSIPIAVDARGDVAATVMQSTNIDVFAPGQTQPYWQITSGLDYTLDALAFDPAGNLYAALHGENTSGSVVEYVPGSSIPARTITNGINRPGALAVDGTGKLYVYNNGSVTVYRAGRGSPIRTITNGIGGDESGVGSGLALDSSENLYVANEGSLDPSMHDPGAITVYAPGRGKPFRTITQGIQNPVAVAIGP